MTSKQLERFDICIIGAGPAGLILASELSAANYKVALVESGYFERISNIQKLNEGALITKYHSNDANYNDLSQDRVRQYGGGSSIWGGMVAPLDSEDFDYRGWVPNSGWPISLADIQKYYNQASDLLGIPYFGTQSLSDQSKKFYYADTNQFTNKLKIILRKNNNVKLFLGATAKVIHVNQSNKAVTYVECVNSLTGLDNFKLVANNYIICSGGIESTRLLLSSPDVLKNNNLVGKFFQGHGHAFGVGNIFVNTNAVSQFNYEEKINPISFNMFKLSKVNKIKYKTLNCYISILARSEMINNNKKSLLSEGVDKFINPKWDSYKTELLLETSPKIDNQIFLTEDFDHIGMRKVNIKYSYSDLEFHTIKKAYYDLAGYLGVRSVGRVWFGFDVDQIFKLLDPSLAKHHLGTTRMGLDSKTSVVDINCKVHDFDNLFVCSSSVFPTSGAVNPTFTILALAYRLSDFLKNESNKT